MAYRCLNLISVIFEGSHDRTLGFFVSNNWVQVDIEGLPEGYSGLLFVVAPSFKAGVYLPMNELIAPSSTSHGKDHETIWAFVWPDESLHECCGWFSFDCLPDRVIPDNADVAPSHRGRGIASSVYRFVLHISERDMYPSATQTSDAQALWKKLAPNAQMLKFQVQGHPPCPA
ncbi:hypothetical protein [Paenirhodobacter populi]|uniref:N-acetyltransferase domain-containing protein n=1 Tax=Paenirhodobacter populi TaxID=2306993 RepID=A0A443J0B7_9RHOB|nr:hypothetical protein [Sinirhodobacter populi]RWR13803.1 hypothetical protein D2T33_05235 [Sinirhodobacter populi]